MAGMFLTGKRMYDLKKSEERTNAQLKRAGMKTFILIQLFVDALIQ